MMMNSCLFLILLVSLLLCIASATDSNPNGDACKLECNNRGSCKFGDADFAAEFGDGPDGKPYDFHKETNIDGMYCTCDPGWTGVKCDHSFQRCDEKMNKCFHNGLCGAVNNSGQLFHICDCRAAIENEIRYIGLHCERESPEEHPNGGPVGGIEGALICNNIGSEYCLSGGTCKPSGGSDVTDHGGSDICDCPATHTGRHCQLVAEELPVQTCSLQCLNGGQCIFGYRDKTDAEIAFDPGSDFVDPGRPDKEVYQHCICQDGFSGTHCEREHTQCGDKFCFHGSKCTQVEVTDNEGGMEVVNQCNCVTAKNNTHSFAGVHCEQHSTSFCGTEGANGCFFCTNNGQCRADGNGLYGCDCESLFCGLHCEFHFSVGGGCGVLSMAPCTSLAPTTAPLPPNFCFSGSNKVQTRDRGIQFMKDLKLGDHILVSSTDQYEPIYSFGHKHDTVMAEFITIDTATSSTVELTPDHMIYVIGKGFIGAGQVQVGDELKPSGQIVTSVSDRITRQGIYAPFTPSSQFMVEGIVVSSFTNTIGMPFQLDHAVGHAFQAPHRLYCHVFPCQTEDYDVHGASSWLVRPIAFANWLQGLGSASLTRGMILFILLPLVVLMGMSEWLPKLLLVSVLWLGLMKLGFSHHKKKEKRCGCPMSQKTIKVN